MRNIEATNHVKEHVGDEAVLVYTPATENTPAREVMRLASGSNSRTATRESNVMVVGTDEEIAAEAVRLGL